MPAPPLALPAPTLPPLLTHPENRFGDNLISVFDYANDSLARRIRRVDNLIVTNDFGDNVRCER